MATLSKEGARTQEPGPAVVFARASLLTTPGWLLVSACGRAARPLGRPGRYPFAIGGSGGGGIIRRG